MIDLSKFEESIIFGSILESFGDIQKLDEAGATNKTVMTQGQIADARKKVAELEIEAAKAKKSGNNILYNDLKKNIKNLELLINNSLIKNIQANREDDLSGDPLVEEESSTATVENSLRKQIEAKRAQIERLRQDKQDSSEKVDAQIAVIEKQINSIQSRLGAAKEATSISEDAGQSSTTSFSNSNSENSKNETQPTGIEKDKANAEGAVDKPDPGIAYPNKPTNSIEEDSISTIDSDEEIVKTRARQFSKMLFNGSSGDALKYFIYGDITDGNRSELNIARLMMNDRECKAVINKIVYLLKKSGSGKFDDEDYMELKVQKSKFRQLFHKYKSRK